MKTLKDGDSFTVKFFNVSSDPNSGYLEGAETIKYYHSEEKMKELAKKYQLDISVSDWKEMLEMKDGISQLFAQNIKHFFLFLFNEPASLSWRKPCHLNYVISNNALVIFLKIKIPKSIHGILNSLILLFSGNSFEIYQGRRFQKLSYLHYAKSTCLRITRVSPFRLILR